MITVAMAVPVSIAAWTRSVRHNELALFAEQTWLYEGLTVVPLPPVKRALPDEEVENESKNKPE
jgi:hypothetical protein